jgi:hypothetical protein
MLGSSAVTNLHKIAFLALSLGLSCNNNAEADSLMEFITTSASAKSGQVQTVSIKDGKIMFKSNSSIDLAYSVSPEKLFIIDHRNRSIQIVDEAQINHLAQQAETIQPMLQGFSRQLSKLDPKQRAKWEKMLGGSISLHAISEAAEPSKPARFVKTGKFLRVADLPCEQINIVEAGANTAELCIAEPAKLNFTDNDYATVRSMLSFFQHASSKASGFAKPLGVNIPNFENDEISGVPVQVIGLSYVKGTVQLKRATASIIPEEQFKLPQNYSTEPFKLWK